MSANPKPRAREATYADVLAAPEHQIAEIIDGELVLSPRPALPHAHVASQAGGEILILFGRRPGGKSGGPGGWWIIDEPELHFGRQVLVPDLAGWRRERMPVMPGAAFCEVPPDWVCEVVSPASARHDRIRKMRIYGEVGVRHAWLVDPRERMVEAFRFENGHWVRVGAYEEDEKARIEPFEAVEFDLSEWWLPTAPPEVDPAPPAAEPPADPPPR